MAMVEIYPMTFEPVFKGYIWGGRNLETLYGRKLPEGVVAESWEISAFPGAATRVTSGYWKWRTLLDVVNDLGGHLLGTKVRERFGIRFPLLVKLLDAQRDLSVQVHPDDAYAAAHEDGAWGKSEMWYVLHAKPGAELILGLNPGVTRSSFASSLQDGHISDQLQRLPVQVGDVLNIPAGTIHALLAGVVVAEIQQNSDTTYRVYDWGRVGPDGKPRPLHIDKALDVISWESPLARPVMPQLISEANGLRQELLVDSAHFTVERLRLAGGAEYQNQCDGSTFQIIGCISGAGNLLWTGAPLAMNAICFTLLPAIMEDYRIRATADSLWLRAYIR